MTNETENLKTVFMKKYLLNRFYLYKMWTIATHLMYKIFIFTYGFSMGYCEALKQHMQRKKEHFKMHKQTF